MKVEIWSDVGCPWCFIGKRRFEAALDEFPHADEVEVRWRSFQLDPTLPEHYDGTELDYLATRKGVERSRVRAMFEHVARQAAGEGLAYDFDRVVVANSFRAHQLLHLAESHGLGDAAEERLFTGHFERGEDIGDLDQMVAIGVELGLDADEVQAALADGRHAAAVRADIAEARELGISGVPFFVIDRRYGVSGAQPVDVFVQALDQAWHAAQPLQMVTAEGRSGHAAGAPDDPAAGAACGPDGCPP